MSYFRKLSSVLSIILISALFLPSTLFAESPKGTVIINVLDEDGQPFSGEWYLHTGTSVNGLVKRNGSVGETFQADAGSYFLEVRGLPGDHPYTWLFSDNPQTLDEDASITFTTQYFETEEAMLTASGNPPEVPEQQATEDDGPTFVYDENGCNATLGYVWCEKDAACVKFWSPSCKVEDKEPVEEIEEPTPSEPAPAPVTVITDPASYIQVPSFEMAPVSSPAPDDTEDDEEETAILPVQLAQTGAATAIPLAASMLVSFAILRRRR